MKLEQAYQFQLLDFKSKYSSVSLVEYLPTNDLNIAIALICDKYNVDRKYLICSKLKQGVINELEDKQIWNVET